jgi:hypothetical protein
MSTTFTGRLNAAVDVAKVRFQLNDNVAFLVWFGINILDLSEDEALEASSIDGSNDKGIDFFHVDDEQGRVIVAQGKYAPDMKVNVKESHLSNLESSLHWLSNPESLRREGKSDLAQAAEDYLKAVSDGYGVELWCVYTVMCIMQTGTISKAVDLSDTFHMKPFILCGLRNKKGVQGELRLTT